MSLKALMNLMDQKGYYFIGTNMQKNNAFFISKNFTKEYFFSDNQFNEIFNLAKKGIREIIEIQKKTLA